jgi:hypothetical protein
VLHVKVTVDDVRVEPGVGLRIIAPEAAMAET